jgi:hypothetical protein
MPTRVFHGRKTIPECARLSPQVRRYLDNWESQHTHFRTSCSSSRAVIAWVVASTSCNVGLEEIFEKLTSLQAQPKQMSKGWICEAGQMWNNKYLKTINRSRKRCAEWLSQSLNCVVKHWCITVPKWLQLSLALMGWKHKSSLECQNARKQSKDLHYFRWVSIVINTICLFALHALTCSSHVGQERMKFWRRWRKNWGANEVCVLKLSPLDCPYATLLHRLH